MDDTDILAAILTAVDTLPALPLEFAATGLGPDMTTPPKPLVECYVLSGGEVDFSVRQLQLRVRDGDLVVANAHYGSQARRVAGDPRHACISLAVDRIPRLAHLGARPLLYRRALRPDSRERIAAACRSVELALHLRDAAFAGIRRRAAYLQLLIDLADSVGSAAQQGAGQSGLPERIMAWLARQSMHRPLDLDPLLDELGLGSRHCNRVFNTAFGRTPRQQHLRLRLERARALLEHGDGSVKEVAAQVGFDDPLYFSRQFASAFGRRPSSYARRRGLGDG